VGPYPDGWPGQSGSWIQSEGTMIREESPIPPEAMADLAEVCRLVASGQRVTDPELLKRIRERSEKATREIFERHGLLDIAVPYIRELRDGADE
jgi:hypothetical protein